MPDTPPLMRCGHWANGWQGDRPVCVICVGITEGADEPAPADDQPVFPLMFRCSSCRREAVVISSGAMRSVAFARLPEPGQTMGSYYCGCRGWD